MAGSFILTAAGQVSSRRLETTHPVLSLFTCHLREMESDTPAKPRAVFLRSLPTISFIPPSIELLAPPSRLLMGKNRRKPKGQDYRAAKAALQASVATNSAEEPGPKVALETASATPNIDSAVPAAGNANVSSHY